RGQRLLEPVRALAVAGPGVAGIVAVLHDARGAPGGASVACGSSAPPLARGGRKAEFLGSNAVMRDGFLDARNHAALLFPSEVRGLLFEGLNLANDLGVALCHGNFLCKLKAANAGPLEPPLAKFKCNGALIANECNPDVAIPFRAARGSRRVS